MFRKRIYEIREQLKKSLPLERYEHSINVSLISSALAMCYDVDIQKAELAGLLHDCAKGIKPEKLEILLKKAGILLSEEDKKTPQNFHAIYGPILAEQVYDIKDKEIYSAIRWHTTGCKNMQILDKIIYIADYIEPIRDKAKNLSNIRQSAFSDLDITMYKILEETISHLQKKKAFIHPKTFEAYEWFQEMIKGNKKY